MADNTDQRNNTEETLKGLDSPTSHEDDPVGKFYIIFAILWTLFICGSLVWLYSLRNSVAIRIRNFWLITATVVVIHMYEITVLIRYPVGVYFTCNTEYWIMSLILPLGVALFQTSNIQLLSYYEEQQSLVQWSFLRRGKRLFRQTPRELVRNWKTLSIVNKTYIGIFIGAIIQVFITIFLFFGSYVFHADYGFFGPANEGCRRAYEWIPSIFWQFLWAYGFGPYILYRTRSIRDTHHWALQTRLAILASLPGSPMWLIFRHVSTPAVEQVNRFAAPAIWFLPGLMVIQLVSIFIPIHDARKIKQLRSRTTSLYSNSTTKSRDQYSMSALEAQISEDIDSLLIWTSKREFTAENIVFLKAVRDFRRKWATEEAKGRPLSTEQIRQRYEEAGLIFFNLVNPNTARFNINIDAVTYRQLESAFSALVTPDISPNAPGGGNLICPWNDDFQRLTETARSSSGSETKLVDEAKNTYQSQVLSVEMKDRGNSEDSPTIMPSTLPTAMVPPAFDPAVFDRAYASIRYLVFTNTWVKFVNSQDTSSVSESFWSSSTKV